MKQVLVIGGSGHVSGAVSRAAVAAGYKVYTLTRGTRPAVADVVELHADRHDAEAMQKVAQSIANEKFDAVIDCICYNADDMKQDLELFAPLTDNLLFVSTDWVYEPTLRRFPQPVENSPYITSDNNGFEPYAWGKLMAENYLREMTKPLLVMQGEQDFQVKLEKDFSFKVWLSENHYKTALKNYKEILNARKMKKHGN